MFHHTSSHSPPRHSWTNVYKVAWVQAHHILHWWVFLDPQQQQPWTFTTTAEEGEHVEEEVEEVDMDRIAPHLQCFSDEELATMEEGGAAITFVPKQWTAFTTLAEVVSDIAQQLQSTVNTRITARRCPMRCWMHSSSSSSSSLPLPPPPAHLQPFGHLRPGLPPAASTHLAEVGRNAGTQIFVEWHGDAEAAMAADQAVMGKEMAARNRAFYASCLSTPAAEATASAMVAIIPRPRPRPTPTPRPGPQQHTLPPTTIVLRVEFPATPSPRQWIDWEQYIMQMQHDSFVRCRAPMQRVSRSGEDGGEWIGFPSATEPLPSNRSWSVPAACASTDWWFAWSMSPRTVALLLSEGFTVSFVVEVNEEDTPITIEQEITRLLLPWIRRTMASFPTVSAEAEAAAASNVSSGEWFHVHALHVQRTKEDKGDEEERQAVGRHYPWIVSLLHLWHCGGQLAPVSTAASTSTVIDREQCRWNAFAALFDVEDEDEGVDEDKDEDDDEDEDEDEGVKKKEDDETTWIAQPWAIALRRRSTAVLHDEDAPRCPFHCLFCRRRRANAQEHVEEEEDGGCCAPLGDALFGRDRWPSSLVEDVTEFFHQVSHGDALGRYVRASFLHPARLSEPVHGNIWHALSAASGRAVSEWLEHWSTTATFAWFVSFAREWSRRRGTAGAAAIASLDSLSTMNPVRRWTEKQWRWWEMAERQSHPDAAWIRQIDMRQWMRRFMEYCIRVHVAEDKLWNQGTADTQVFFLLEWLRAHAATLCAPSSSSSSSAPIGGSGGGIMAWIVVRHRCVDITRSVSFVDAAAHGGVPCVGCGVICIGGETSLRALLWFPSHPRRNSLAFLAWKETLHLAGRWSNAAGEGEGEGEGDGDGDGEEDSGVHLAESLRDRLGWKEWMCMCATVNEYGECVGVVVEQVRTQEQVWLPVRCAWPLVGQLPRVSLHAHHHWQSMKTTLNLLQQLHDAAHGELLCAPMLLVQSPTVRRNNDSGSRLVGCITQSKVFVPFATPHTTSANDSCPSFASLPTVEWGTFPTAAAAAATSPSSNKTRFVSTAPAFAAAASPSPVLRTTATTSSSPSVGMDVSGLTGRWWCRGQSPGHAAAAIVEGNWSVHTCREWPRRGWAWKDRLVTQHGGWRWQVYPAESWQAWQQITRMREGAARRALFAITHSMDVWCEDFVPQLSHLRRWIQHPHDVEEEEDGMGWLFLFADGRWEWMTSASVVRKVVVLHIPSAPKWWWLLQMEGTVHIPASQLSPDFWEWV